MVDIYSGPHFNHKVHKGFHEEHKDQGYGTLAYFVKFVVERY